MGNNNLISPKEISLKDFIIKFKEWSKFLLSRWYILIISSLIGGSIGLVYATLKKPIYIAETSFVLETGDKAGTMGQYMGLASMIGIDLGGGDGGIFQGDNLLELYRSHKMIEATLMEVPKINPSKRLIYFYLDESKAREKWKADRSFLKDIDFDVRKQKNSKLQRGRDSVFNEAVKDIRENYLEVGKLDKKLSIIKVIFKSKSEVFSKEFNNELVVKVNEFYVQTKTKKSSENIQILQHKTDSVRAVMNNSISSVAVTIDATPNLNPTRQAQRLVPTQRGQFSAETNKAILGQLVQNLELGKISLLKEAPLIQEIDVPIYPLKVEKVGRLKAIIVGVFISFCLIIFAITIYKIINSIVENEKF
jgi:hypothetical protein